MDFTQPVEALIPGVQGRILGVLARTEAELSMRTVARLAGVSPNRATMVLHQLIQLGLVERRDVGTSAQVRLVGENEATRLVLELARLSETVLQRMAAAAKDIAPAPASLIVFGSFARGQAGAASDLDALAVRADDVSVDDAAWTGTLGRWSDLAGRIAGNPVNLLVVSQAELPQLAKRQGSVWAEIVRYGVTLVGEDVRQLGSAA